MGVPSALLISISLKHLCVVWTSELGRDILRAMRAVRAVRAIQIKLKRSYISESKQDTSFHKPNLIKIRHCDKIVTACVTFLLRYLLSPFFLPSSQSSQKSLKKLQNMPFSIPVFRPGRLNPYPFSDLTIWLQNLNYVTIA